MVKWIIRYNYYVIIVQKGLLYFSATKFIGFGELIFKKENHFRGKKKLLTKLKKAKVRLFLENI